MAAILARELPENEATRELAAELPLVQYKVLPTAVDAGLVRTAPTCAMCCGDVLVFAHMCPPCPPDWDRRGGSLHCTALSRLRASCAADGGGSERRHDLQHHRHRRSREARSRSREALELLHRPQPDRCRRSEMRHTLPLRGFATCVVCGFASTLGWRVTLWIHKCSPTGARRRFARSLAAYVVFTFLLGVGDRHLENVMVRKMIPSSQPLAPLSSLPEHDLLTYWSTSPEVGY